MRSSFHTVIFFLVLNLPVSAQRVFEISRPGDQEGKDRVFVSLSDVYRISEHPDSLPLPNIEEMGKQEAAYFTLPPKYRKRLLRGTGVSESDSLFVYDYAKDLLMRFAIKNLPAIASINSYANEEDWPYRQFEYMIGFELNPNLLKGTTAYYTHTYVCIDKTNPFTKGKMKPLIWKQIPAVNYPKNRIDTAKYREISTLLQGNHFLAEADSLKFYVSEYLLVRKYQQNKETRADTEIAARRLVVIEMKTKQLVCEKIYIDTESYSPAPLNNVGPGGKDLALQYTGKLFTDRPAVVFGFEFCSFGCLAITFLKSPGRDLYINCDSRH